MENLTKVPTDTVEVKTEKHGEYTAEITRDYDGKIDIFYLNTKDPNFAYRFLRNEFKNISIKSGNILTQKGGWQICPKEHLLRVDKKFFEKKLDAHGHYKMGDTILAFMPKDLYNEKEVHKQKQASMPMNAVERLMKHGDKNIGKDIHPSMKGIQTKDELKGNWK